MQTMKQLISLLLSAMLLFSCALAEETVSAPELTPEELAQWAEWSGEGSELGDASAKAGAAELTPE